MEALQLLPQSGSIFNLRSYDEDDNKEVKGNTDFGGLASGPHQDYATGPLSNEENTYITEAHACINPLHQDKTAEINIINTLNAKLGTAKIPYHFLLLLIVSMNTHIHLYNRWHFLLYSHLVLEMLQIEIEYLLFHYPNQINIY